MQNGEIVFHNRTRDGLYLEDDIFVYDCDEDYMFNVGNSEDYVYKCTSGGWNNTVDTPICITSETMFKKIFPKVCTSGMP